MADQNAAEAYQEHEAASEAERGPDDDMEAISTISSREGTPELHCEPAQVRSQSLASPEDEHREEEKQAEAHCDVSDEPRASEKETSLNAPDVTQEVSAPPYYTQEEDLSEQKPAGSWKVGRSEQEPPEDFQNVDLEQEPLEDSEHVLLVASQSGSCEQGPQNVIEIVYSEQGTPVLAEVGGPEHSCIEITAFGNSEQGSAGVIEKGYLEHKPEEVTKETSLERRPREVSEERGLEQRPNWATAQEDVEQKHEGDSEERPLKVSIDLETRLIELDDDSTTEPANSTSLDNTLEDFPSIPSVVADTSELSPPAAPVQRDEDITAEGWRTRRKHVFVLSEAGKPIYSRYGNEEALSSTMGVMMALVSFVQSGNNCIRSIYSDNQKVVFLQQGPLVLVSVSRTPQTEEQLRLELQYVYYQIISMLTQASVARIFERKKNYDLRRLLTGSEKILDSLLDLLETDPGFLLRAVRCLPLSTTLRDSLSNILTKAITPNLVFSILVAEQQIVTVVQERAVIEDCRLDPADLHLLLNLIGASSAFQAGEIWTPICLPRFNPDGYFYAYISYLDPGCTVCLVLLSTDKESFYAVSACKTKIQEAMEAQNSLQMLAVALRSGSYSASLVGVPELLHFVYKPLDIPDSYRQLPQFTSPEAEGPYASEEERQRLFDLYRYLHCRIHNSARPLRLIYHVAEKETLLAWVTSKFELYTAFSSLVTKVGAINVITKLLRWIKKEEDRLFIRYPPKYSTTPLPGRSAKANRTDRTDPPQNGFFSGL